MAQHLIFTALVLTCSLCGTVEGVDCLVTDGSAANDATCKCGTETCNSVNGLICFSTTGGGSCRKTDVGAYGYNRPTS